MPKRFLIFLLITCQACRSTIQEEDRVLEAFEQQLNKETESRIDAAYMQVQHDCDSLMLTKVPLMVDSVLKTIDSL